MQDRDINFKNISASGFNGEIKANGYISTIRPVVMMKFGVGLGNVDPSLILEKLLNYKNYSGYVTTKGIFSSKGVNYEEVKQNLGGTLNIIGKNIVYKWFRT